MDERFVVPPALEGERLDRAVAILTGRSRREVDQLVRSGRVGLGNGRRPSRSRRVVAGDELSVSLGPGSGEPSGLRANPEVIVPVVWFDEQVVLVDKPPGMVVHPGAGHPEGTVVQGLLARFPDLAGAGGQEAGRPGVVHRLDKGTSGLMVVARTPLALASLQAQMSTRSAGRVYRAMVQGWMEADAGTVDAPVGRSRRDPTRMGLESSGRPARTHYEVEDRLDGPFRATLLRCRLETGRTHQIRVHLSSIGHPVVGDATYGRGGRTGGLLAPGRLFLHAAEIAFDHPVSGQRMGFRSDLPPDLLSVLDGFTRHGIPD